VSFSVDTITPPTERRAWPWRKQCLLDAAELFDAWRVVPRVLLFADAAVSLSILIKITWWYCALRSVDRTSTDAIVIGILVPSVAGLFTAAFKFYIDTGRNWVDK